MRCASGSGNTRRGSRRTCVETKRGARRTGRNSPNEPEAEVALRRCEHTRWKSWHTCLSSADRGEARTHVPPASSRLEYLHPPGEGPCLSVRALPSARRANPRRSSRPIRASADDVAKVRRVLRADAPARSRRRDDRPGRNDENARAHVSSLTLAIAPIAPPSSTSSRETSSSSSSRPDASSRRRRCPPSSPLVPVVPVVSASSTVTTPDPRARSPSSRAATDTARAASSPPPTVTFPSSSFPPSPSSRVARARPGRRTRVRARQTSTRRRSRAPIRRAARAVDVDVPVPVVIIVIVGAH